eukprot:1024070-Amphidinium_carterae.1
MKSNQERTRSSLTKSSGDPNGFGQAIYSTASIYEHDKPQRFQMRGQMSHIALPLSPATASCAFMPSSREVLHSACAAAAAPAHED